ncbi:MAG: sugar phosphate isomerase/epimerase family protein [Terriglobia bacterium]
MAELITRRTLIGSSLAGAGMMAAPSKRLGNIKMGIYSITYLGYWYRGDALTMEQVADRAKMYGYEGIEIEGKRPHGFPLDWPKRRCQEFKKYVADKGLAISGVAADNDFSSPITEHREAQLALVHELIRMTSELDAKVLRIYLVWSGATKLQDGGGRYDIAQKIWDYTQEKFTDTQRWEWCRDCFIEAARWAGDYGVTLALQNHKPIITNYNLMLKMIKEVNSPYFKACLDAPLLENKEADYVRKAVFDTGSLQVQSHFGGDFEREGPGKPIQLIGVRGQWGGEYVRLGPMKDNFYLPFCQALYEVGYNGFISYELCHPLHKVNGQVVGLDYAHTSTQLAAEFMRNTLAQARKAAAAKLEV